MKAAIIKRWGSPEVLEIVDIPKPAISDDQLMIKVYSTGLNPVDWKQRKGNHKYILGSPFPIVLGYDVCGEVVEIGRNVTKFKAGDIVMGDLDNKYGGASAEFAVGHEMCFAPKPKLQSINQSAATALASLTALQAMRDKAGLQKGQSILINGASGGVGHIAIQIARNLGAHVIAVASYRNKEFVRQFKPDIFIDYTSDNILDLSEKVDVFFDVVGNYSFLKTKKLLKPGGTYVSTLPRPKILFHKIIQPFSSGKKVKTILRKQNRADLNQITQWIEKGLLKIEIDQTFRLEEISRAHEYGEQNRIRGKVVIEINS